MLLEHRVPARCLFRFGVGVNRRFRNHRGKIGRIGLAPSDGTRSSTSVFWVAYQF